jgi:hypothetical protein
MTTDETVFKAHKEKGSLSVPAVALIAAGLLLLVVNVFNISLMSYLWPGFILGFGLLLLWPAHQSTAEQQSSVAFLAVPGMMVAATGLILFVLNLTNHFESMAYAWPLFLAAAAGGIMYMNRFDQLNTVHQSGRRFIRMMGFLFIGLAAFFEFLIFRSFGPWWPLALVALGAYLLVQNKKVPTK